MRATSILATGLLALTLTILLRATPGHAAAFVPGEILLNESGSSKIQRYSATGTLLQTFTGTGTGWRGAALTPDGNLVTAFLSPSPGIDIFSPNGTQTASFAATGNGNPLDVSVFPDGTLALCDFSNGSVQFWSQAGEQGPTVALPDITNPYGSTVGSDGILYVAGGTTNKLARVSAAGVWLGNVNLPFSPGDLVMNPVDGTLWVSGVLNQQVEHITTTGTVLGIFPSGFIGGLLGIGLAADNKSLYVTSTQGTVVKHLGLGGNPLGSFALTSATAPYFITVVPTPEPGSAALLLGGCALLAARRGRRKV